jgi:hypothetical protein
MESKPLIGPECLERVDERGAVRGHLGPETGDRTEQHRCS